MIFDDLFNSDKKVQQKISEYFLRGRKMNITNLYLLQSYFKTLKFIRINCLHILLRVISSKRDLAMILRDYELGVRESSSRVFIYSIEPFQEQLGPIRRLYVCIEYIRCISALYQPI